MTQAQTERTAGKWKLSPTDDTCIIDAERNVVAEISGDYNSPDTWPLMEANARFIVTACNAHDELVAALRNSNSLLRMLLIVTDQPEAVQSQIDENDAALSELEDAA